jgi:hypothetical protein
MDGVQRPDGGLPLALLDDAGGEAQDYRADGFKMQQGLLCAFLQPDPGLPAARGK